MDKLKLKWEVGFRDRGLGHGDFAVLYEDQNVTRKTLNKLYSEQITGKQAREILEKIYNKKLSSEELVQLYINQPSEDRLVVECDSFEEAKHIVEVHNKELANVEKQNMACNDKMA